MNSDQNDQLELVPGDHLAREASRYLSTVEAFAALGADPHAAARTQAARTRVLDRDRIAAAAAPIRSVARWR